MSTPASFKIEYQRQGSLLRANVTGMNGTLETTLAYWMALAEETRRNPSPCLLVVDDMAGEPPPAEQIAEFVKAMVGMKFEGVRVAYVEAHAQQTPDVEYGEVRARGQGFDARVFGNEADAALWLRHGMS